MVQPVVQQFEVPNFDIHEDRSITMAVNTKKKQELTEMNNVSHDKENASKFPVPITAGQQNVCSYNACKLSICDFLKMTRS